MPDNNNLPARATKRTIDVLFAAAALVLLSPVLFAIAVLVFLDSGLPIFYGHERIGRNFRSFSVIKFRTMRANVAGPSLTVAGDARITAVGKVLRRWKVDELPQLWNVFIGEMSLVGPRPEVARYVTLFQSRYRKVLKVRPGVTDLASIRFRNEEKILAASPRPTETYEEQILPEKLRLAEEYVDNWSVGWDLKLILQTVWTIARPHI